LFVCAELSPDVQAWLKGDGAFAQAAKKSVLKPRTMMDIDGVDHFELSEDQEIPDGIKLDFDANQDVSMSPVDCVAVNGFAEAAQMSVVKPGNDDHFWPLGDDLVNPVARGLDFNSAMSP
jgi:hypothetical protein